jgi:hypothetical protein
MVKRYERISEVASRRVVKSSLDGSAFTDFFISCHGHWVAAIVVDGVLEESSSNQIESGANWYQWGCTNCGSCGHRCRNKSGCTDLKSWALTWRWLRLRLRIDGCQDDGHVSLVLSLLLMLQLLLESSEIGLLLLLKLLLE